MISTVQAIRNTFSKPAKRVSDTIVQRENMSEEEASMTTLREFRRNRVKTKPIPSHTTSVFD